MNRYFIALILSGTLSLAYLYFSPAADRSGASTSKILPATANEAENNTALNQTLTTGDIAPSNSKSHDNNQDVPRIGAGARLMDEETSIRLRRESMVDGAGYSEDGAEALERGESIALQDMPESLRDEYQKELDSLRKDGYLTISEDDMSDIVEVSNRLIGQKNDNIKNINFEPSKIPRILKDKYQYSGYAFDPVSYSEKNGSPSNTLRRVFIDPDTSSTIMLEEEPITKDYNSSMVKEFVNAQINGREAKFEIHKSPANRTYSMLTWSTDAHVYTIFQFGTPANKQEVIAIGNELSQINATPR